MITEQTEYTLPSNPKDREKIKRKIEDMVDLMHQKAALDSTIKEYAVAMKDELGIPTKITSRLAKTLFKEQVDGNEFDKINAEHEVFTDAFDILFRGADTSTQASDDGEEEEEEE